MSPVPVIVGGLIKIAALVVAIAFHSRMHPLLLNLPLHSARVQTNACTFICRSCIRRVVTCLACERKAAHANMPPSKQLEVIIVCRTNASAQTGNMSEQVSAFFVEL